MRKLLFTLTFLVLFVTVGVAQAVKGSASILVTEVKPQEALEYLKGISVDLDARVFEKSGYRLGGVFNYQKTFNRVVFEDYQMPGPLPAVASMDIQRNVNTYSLGFQLSKKAGPVEPFAAFLLGARKPHEDLDYQIVRKARFGADIIFHKKSNFFIRPFFVEFEGDGTHQFGAGAGFRF